MYTWRLQCPIPYQSINLDWSSIITVLGNSCLVWSYGNRCSCDMKSVLPAFPSKLFKVTLHTYMQLTFMVTPGTTHMLQFSLIKTLEGPKEGSKGHGLQVEMFCLCSKSVIFSYESSNWCGDATFYSAERGTCSPCENCEGWWSTLNIRECTSQKLDPILTTNMLY